MRACRETRARLAMPLPAPALSSRRRPHLDAERTMSRAILLLGLAGTLAAPGLAATEKDIDLASIHGKIQVVESFPDYRVKIVTSFADLHVKVVESFPDEAGEWQFVDSFPDHRIQFVESFPDFTIRYVESFPGVR
jgi:hypothetical protein